MLPPLMLAATIAGAPGTAATEPPPQPPSAWLRLADGREARVAFDPGRRLVLGLGAIGAKGRAEAGLALEGGLHLRSDATDSEAEITWRTDTALLAGRWSPAQGRLDADLYQTTWRRHSHSSRLLFPTVPPVSMPLPFDIGFGLALGHVEVAPGRPGLAAELLRAEILTDFWESPRPGRWAALGLVADVGARFAGAGTVTHPAEAFLTPLSGLTLRVHGESARGLLVADLHADLLRRWSSVRGWENVGRARGELEVVPLAVNDLPLGVVLAASAERAPDRGGALDATAWAGVRLGVPVSSGR